MRFSMAARSGRFLLRLRTYGSLADRCLRVLFNRYVVPLRAMRLEGDRLEFDVPADAFRSGDQILSLTCAPCDPGGWGATDYRSLGVAISSIRFERHASAQ
jgi:hypothetical protein